MGNERDELKLRHDIARPATLKYRLEDEMIIEYVAALGVERTPVDAREDWRKR